MNSKHAILGAAMALCLVTTTTTARAQTAPEPVAPGPAAEAPPPATLGPVAAPPPPAPPPMVVHVPTAQVAPVAPVAPEYQYYAAPARGTRRTIVGYRNETRNPPALWGTGLGLLLAGWVLDFAVLTPIANLLSEDRSGANEQDAWAWSLVPVAGPLIQLGIGAPHPAIPILTGLLQVGGLITFVVGMATTESHRAAIYQGDPDDPSMLTVELDASPLESGGMIGITIRHL